MPEMLSLRGFIKGISYKAHLTESLTVYSVEGFDINQAKPFGLIQAEIGQVAYSKWVSPKRTRTYPFERIYNTYNAPKILTVIPVIKDEGIDGDLDKIQYSTFSWMNLLNVYIVLGYYETAEKSERQPDKRKLSNQQFNSAFVNAQIHEIIDYKQSALHWNKNLFESRFTQIFETAMAAYHEISVRTKVAVHPQRSLKRYVERIIADFEKFKLLSLKSSQSASHREVQTMHRYEDLGDGIKAQLTIENYLGGLYYLTVDEVMAENGKLILQESKNTKSDELPQTSDIKDGLFKLILYSNLDTVMLGEKAQPFSCRLKLTGSKVNGRLSLPASDAEVEAFFKRNSALSLSQREMIRKLDTEARHNKLSVEIRPAAR